MKTFAAWIIVAALPLGIAPVHASPELAAKSNCMACHDMQKKKMGPSFTEISTKYKMGLGCGKGDSEAMLTDSILKGSKNKWGKIPMPAQNIPPADAQALSRWILGC